MWSSCPQEVATAAAAEPEAPHVAPQDWWGPGLPPAHRPSRGGQQMLDGWRVQVGLLPGSQVPAQSPQGRLLGQTGCPQPCPGACEDPATKLGGGFACPRGSSARLLAPQDDASQGRQMGGAELQDKHLL